MGARIKNIRKQDDATFADPLTKAEGRKQYEAQWYGLVAAFSEIVPLPYPAPLLIR